MRSLKFGVVCLLSLFFSLPALASCMPDRIGVVTASWYGPGHHGRPTASGEIFDRNSLTAAHPCLPFGTIIAVRNLETGRSVLVRINDRGPFIAGRHIDLSEAAAAQLGMLGRGVGRVQLSRVDPPAVCPSQRPCGSGVKAAKR